MHGPNAHPTLDDDLGWDELADFDGAFYTGDDARTVVAARRARVLVVTARRLASVVESGVEVDVLIGSANDRNEQLRRRRPARAPAAVRVDGGRRGRPLARRRRRRGALAARASAGAGDRHLRGRGRVHGGAHARARRGAGRDAALAQAARAAAAQLTRRGGGPT